MIWIGILLAGFGIGGLAWALCAHAGHLDDQAGRGD